FVVSVFKFTLILFPVNISFLFLGNFNYRQFFSMKRRDFFKNTAIAAAGTAVLSPFQAVSGHFRQGGTTGLSTAGRAKNIIFMVSDGMSIGTLSMANMLSERRDGRL